ILQNRGKFSKEMLAVVQAISEGRPSDPSTKKAQNIVAKQDQASGNPSAPVAPNQTPSVFLQITRDDQRSDATELVGTLQKAGLDVPGIEFVNPGTQNNYVRYFSAGNKQYADKVLESMKSMGFQVQEQDFSTTPLRENTVPG